MKNGGPPIYADEGSSVDVWEHEALRSQQWADEAREQARRYYRRQRIMGWIVIALAATLVAAIVALLVMYAIDLSQR